MLVYENTVYNFRLSYSPAQFQPQPGVMGAVITFVASVRTCIVFIECMRACAVIEFTGFESFSVSFYFFFFFLSSPNSK